MQPETLVLIEDDLDAQRLIVTWPEAGADWGSPELEATEENLPVDEWARISGVYGEDLLRRWPMLYRNGFIGPMGTVDALAARWIRSRLALRLPRPKQRTTPPAPPGGTGGQRG